MKLLLVKGDKHVGKSTTCRWVYLKLKSSGATTKFMDLINGFGDIETVLTWNGSKIAIYTAGDEKQNLINARRLADKWDCDVLIAAVTKGLHHNETLSDLEDGKDIFWFQLEKGSDETEMDKNEELLTKEIISKTEEIIN